MYRSHPDPRPCDVVSAFLLKVDAVYFDNLLRIRVARQEYDVDVSHLYMVFFIEVRYRAPKDKIHSDIHIYHECIDGGLELYPSAQYSWSSVVSILV